MIHANRAARHGGLTIRAGAFEGFRDLAAELGAESSRIFETVGIDPFMLEAPDNKIPVDRFRMALNLASERTGERNFGLLMSQRQSFEKFGILGYLARHAPTVDVMVNKLVTYLRTHDTGSVPSLSVTDKTALCTLKLIGMSNVPTIQHTELALGLVVKLIRNVTSASWAPEALYFNHMRPENYRIHERIFNCPVYYSQSESALELLSKDLSIPLKTSDPGLYALLHKYLDRADEGQGDSFMSVVGNAIKSELDDGKPSLERTAKFIGISPSALQRRLKVEGTTYQNVFQDVRHSVACEFLVNTDLPLSTISSLIGYSEPAIFTRAFKRKAGVTPRYWRQHA
ncbi:AraC family transcriptional regulator [Fretibacter rubidus]|uniref:AraC family transcriptional regulator n=1 Tax=Fretibacter rubidus TaxID=570162 RepID=UPI00352B2FFD